MADSSKKTLDDYWVPWSDIPTQDIARFRDELDAASGEGEMQAFLEAHPAFLCQRLPPARDHWVISTKRLGSEHVTDFLIGEDTPHQPTWHAVELERPQALLFTQRGGPSQALTHAVRQIGDWRDWLARNRDYASRAPALSGLRLGDIDPDRGPGATDATVGHATTTSTRAKITRGEQRSPTTTDDAGPTPTNDPMNDQGLWSHSWSELVPLAARGANRAHLDSSKTASHRRCIVRQSDP